jgi:HAE1 family hydrophobic/amphiphilic exporter-1
MIMAAEFESLWQPFIIMFTVPLSLIGVTLVLFITRTPLSVVAYLGIIMLGGIVVNNGIVLIDFINRLIKQGHTPFQAVVLASQARLRPILMTSLTTILGLSPLALGIGEGAELRAPLALTVIGGLSSATFLTLVVIPALYLIVAETIKPTLAIEAPAAEIKPEQELEPEAEVVPTTYELTPEVEPEEEKEIKEKLEAETELKTEEEIKPAEAEETKPEEKQKAKVEPKEELKPEPEKEKVAVKERLNARQIEILEKLKILKKVTRKEYAEMFEISIPTAARDLKKLLDIKLLCAQGPLGPGRWYELTYKEKRV